MAKLFSECFGHTTPHQVSEWHRKSDICPEDIFLGMVNGKLVAHVNMETKKLNHGEDLHAKTAGIAGVCTDSDYRKEGIGTRLMKYALNEAQQRGISNASLFTGLDNPAIRIYRRLGFVEILTWRTYIKYIDYPVIFAQWLRDLNRSIKDSRNAARKLIGWEKSVVIRLREVGVLSFRFHKGRFQRLKQPPKRPDIDFSSHMQTYARIMRGALHWEDAVKGRKLTVSHGEPADIKMFLRILRWSWDD